MLSNFMVLESGLRLSELSPKDGLLLGELARSVEKWIISPARGALSHDSGEDSLDGSDEAVLVAHEHLDNGTNEPVMDMEGVTEEVVPVDQEAEGACYSREECDVSGEVADCVVQEEDVGNDGGDEENEAEEDNPEDEGPVLHDVPIESQLLEDTVVQVSELEADKVG